MRSRPSPKAATGRRPVTISRALLPSRAAGGCVTLLLRIASLGKRKRRDLSSRRLRGKTTAAAHQAVISLPAFA